MENPAMQEFLDMKGEIEKKVKNVPFILHKINFEYSKFKKFFITQDLGLLDRPNSKPKTPMVISLVKISNS